MAGMTSRPKSVRDSSSQASSETLREHVDAQRSEVALGLLGLLLPVGHAAVGVEGKDAEAMRVADRHLLDGDRDISPVASVRGDERLVVHLVDVVAGQDEHDVAGLLADRLEVDEHCVRRAAVPLGRSAARDVRLEQANAALVAVEVPRPASADVVVQRARVVLRQDEDVVDLRIDAVRQGEVDDPVLARERNGRLGPDGGQDRQPLPLATGKDDGCDRLHAQMLHRAMSPSAASKRCRSRRCRW